MKTIFLLLSLLLSSINFAQVGIDTTTPDASAALDVESTSRGFLPPRMIETERDAITTPAAGLIVWCTNCGSHGELQVFNGTSWTNIIGGAAAEFQPIIGDTYRGGIIAYVLQPNNPGYDANVPHGIIAAPSDQSAGIQWWNGVNMSAFGSGRLIGSGRANTANIVSNQGAGYYAAKICDDLVLNGYSDWYLPSRNELKKLYENRFLIGGFTMHNREKYWSSSENGLDKAWLQPFDGYGVQYSNKKYLEYNVRAIRSF